MPQQETLSDISFPIAGIDLRRGFENQQPVPIPTLAATSPVVVQGTGQLAEPQQWGRTSRFGVNVRSFEALANRKRGGQRPGLVKYIPVAPVAGWLLQDLNALITTSQSAKG